jgi:photosystem II stability/assembly factor-like uncharacterized protein
MKIILTFIFLDIIIFTSKLYPQVYWEKIETPTNYTLKNVFYLDSLHCWVAGDEGVIMFSGNGGTSWEIQNSKVSTSIEEVFFLNELLGWALTYELTGTNIQSKILKTSNGGNEWIANDFRKENVILTTIYFIDSLKGWIGSKPFSLSFTTDAGLNWIEANVDTGGFASFPINKIMFSTPKYGFAVGGLIDNAGVVWQSINGGNSWKAFGIAPDKFDDFVFLDSTSALTLSADIENFYPIGVLNFDLLESRWDYKVLDIYGRVSALGKRSQNEIWATVSNDINFLLSKDSGKSWSSIPTPDSSTIFDIAFADSLHGIAVGTDGFIFKYVPDHSVNIEEEQVKILNKFVLEQNYPNPFNPSTKIRYSVPLNIKNQISKIVLKVYDVLGNEIATLVNEEQTSGVHEIEFNTEWNNRKAIASGIYFYRLQAGSYSETKKMILLR